MTEPPPSGPQQPPYGQQPPPGGPGWGGQPGYPVPPTSSQATTVMVLGIVSLVTFFLFCGLGIIPAVIALVMARGAEREIAASGGSLQGEGQVRTGRITAWITVALTVLLVLVVAGAIGLLVVGSSTTSGAAFSLLGR